MEHTQLLLAHSPALCFSSWRLVSMLTSQEMRGEEEDVMVETGLVLYFSLDLKHVFYAPRYGKTILPLYIDNLY